MERDMTLTKWCWQPLSVQRGAFGWGAVAVEDIPKGAFITGAYASAFVLKKKNKALVLG